MGDIARVCVYFSRGNGSIVFRMWSVCTGKRLFVLNTLYDLPIETILHRTFTIFV